MLLQRLWRCCKEFGPDETLFRSAAGLRLIRDAQTLDIYFKRLDGPGAQAALPEDDRSPTAVFREISKEELERLPKADGMPDAETFEKKFRHGSKLFGVLKEGKLAGVNWVDDRAADLGAIERPRQKLEKGQLYLHGAYVAPAFRRAGLGGGLRQWVLDRLSGEGGRYVFLAIYLDPSAAAWHRKNGFERWGRVFFFRALGLEKTWVHRTKESRGVGDEFLRDRKHGQA